MDKINKLRSAILAALIVFATPGIARADVGEKAVMGFLKALWAKVGPSLIPYLKADWGDWSWLRLPVSIVCMGLTMYWLIAWRPKESKLIQIIVGKAFGPFAIIGFVLMVGVMLVYAAIGFVQGIVAGTINSALGAIPVLGWLLRYFPQVGAFIAGIIAAIVQLVFILGLAWYAIKNIPALIKEVLGVFKAVFSKGMEGEGDVKPSYLIAGALLVASLINRPEFNIPLYGAVSVFSSCLGIYVLLTTTGKGRQIFSRAKAQFTRKPLENGTVLCDNYGVVKQEDTKEWAKGNKKPLPKVKKLTHRFPCGTEIPKGTKACPNPHCGKPAYNLPWDCTCGQKGIEWDKENCPMCGARQPKKPWCCVECGYYGAKNQGIPWETPTCPKCKKPRPLWWTFPFHYIWEEPVKMGKPAAAVPAPAAQAATAAAGAPAPGAPAAAPAPGVQPPAAPPPVTVNLPANSWLCTRQRPVLGPSGKPRMVVGPDRKPVYENGRAKIVVELCNTVNHNSETNCARCGKQNPHHIPDIFEKTCPACGAPYNSKAGFKFCPKCLSPLTAKKDGGSGGSSPPDTSTAAEVDAEVDWDNVPATLGSIWKVR